MSLYGMVKRANQPGAPEHSTLFRASATGSVVVAIAACSAQGELPGWLAAGSIALVVIGNLFSYWRRDTPLPYLKVVLAVVVVGAFVWFFATISSTATAGDLASVERPLAILFTLIQGAHAFDVPSRRDLGFSLAGSATLMAVAAAQAVDTTFGIYVIVWAVFGLLGLLAMWNSMAGGAPLRVRTVLLSAVAIVVVGTAIVAVVPAPHAASNLVFPSALAGDLPVSQPAGLVGAGPQGDEPLRAASAAGATRVGGFLGFAGPLDTAIRGDLGEEVVFRVRADRPTFWVAETFDQWDGQSWTTSPQPAGVPRWRQLDSGPPFDLPTPDGEVTQGVDDYQTFYLAQAGPNLVFHAANALQVWFPSRRLFVGADGTIRAGTSMGAGTIYTVLSAVNTAPPALLARAGPPAGLPGGDLSGGEQARYLQLPHPYPAVAALAQRITAGAPTTYAKVVALEDWIGAHTRYTTDIPPLAPGQDTVHQFLFGNRRGYCEQISTALAVMLRTLGLPAREATGYVPGPYNPLTDLYEVQAKDAHAWVQVWFPGYGWQSFDPTALVPDANPTPGSAIAHDLSGALRRVPVVPVAAVALVLALGLALVWWRRRTPPTWAAAVTGDLVGAARRAGLVVGPGETVLEVAARLERCDTPSGGRGAGVSAGELARAAERAAYFGAEPGPARRRELRRAARALRRRARSLRAGPAERTPETVRSPGAPEPRRMTPRPREGAGRP
jgi:transglutaminase-like putative cysteine protease